MKLKVRNNPIIVTGASGFVGRNLLRFLSGKPVDVCALVRGNASDLQTSGNIKIKRVSSYTDHLPAKGSVLIHLGEPSHVPNLEGMGEMHLGAMMSQAKDLTTLGYEHIVYASSATVYADNHDDMCNPSSPLASGQKLYADTKIAVERIVLNSKGSVARITNIYGPGMSDTNIFSDILSQLRRDGPLKIREGSPVREYLWVTDLVKCLFAMSQKQSQGIFNISINEPISCRDLASLILTSAGQADRNIIAQYPHRHSVLRLDITKTTELFGWKPEVSLKAGIKILLEGKKL